MVLAPAFHHRFQGHLGRRVWMPQSPKEKRIIRLGIGVRLWQNGNCVQSICWLDQVGGSAALAVCANIP